jgi:cyclohexanone monooxygenase
VRARGREHKVDAIVFATGFDAMTGALMKIDIRGRDGLRLQEKWADGPRSYLGVAMAGFPNLFTITGPGSPSVLTNMLPTIEQHVEWIAGAIQHLRDRQLGNIEPVPAAEEAWVAHVGEAPDARCATLAAPGIWASTSRASRACSCPTSAGFPDT